MTVHSLPNDSQPRTDCIGARLTQLAITLTKTFWYQEQDDEYRSEFTKYLAQIENQNVGYINEYDIFTNDVMMSHLHGNQRYGELF